MLQLMMCKINENSNFFFLVYTQWWLRSLLLTAIHCVRPNKRIECIYMNVLACSLLLHCLVGAFFRVIDCANNTATHLWKVTP